MKTTPDVCFPIRGTHSGHYWIQGYLKEGWELGSWPSTSGLSRAALVLCSVAQGKNITRDMQGWPSQFILHNKKLGKYNKRSPEKATSLATCPGQTVYLTHPIINTLDIMARKSDILSGSSLVFGHLHHGTMNLIQETLRLTIRVAQKMWEAMGISCSHLVNRWTTMDMQ